MADDWAEVVAKCQAGDREAQRHLYDRHHRMVYRLAVRMVGRADAADLTQEIFLRVFSRIGGFRGASALPTWLYRIAVNECLRHLGRRRPLEPLIAEPACEAPRPERVLEQADLLERALHDLDASLRAVFLLREVEGLSYQQIAEVLAIAPGTVASQLNRARAELQAFLRRMEQEQQR
ncbi:MAG TPA: sigma-70 family RNA polymerase sigma factor [Gemmataceae bacterium]|nr:sigma-70 family RNA polymerase sigma factor [Gemmataceae bacterium]